MAFKMKRAGVNLRSTTRVAPQLTKYQGSSPLHQDITVKGQGEEPVDIEGVVVNDTTQEGTPRESDPNFVANEDGTNLACNEARRKKFFANDPEGFKAECDGYKKSKITCPDGAKPILNDSGDPVCPGGKSEEISNVTGNYTSPGQMQPLTHILTPREMRRNQRMMRIGSDGDERLIKKANKNIRQAIRRGGEPNPNDLAIISGQALGNYDGLNMKQDSSGYQDWFTGQQFKSVQTMPGGEMSEPKNFNDLVRNKAKSLYEADPSKYPDEASLLAAAEKATERERTILGDGTDDRVKEGKHLTRKTRMLMENRNYDTSNFGEFGKKGKSQKRRDREKRQVTDLRKKASAKDISQKKKDRLNRKITKKGGTPVKMSIELTRPSYKMKGFGN